MQGPAALVPLCWHVVVKPVNLHSATADLQPMCPARRQSRHSGMRKYAMWPGHNGRKAKGSRGHFTAASAEGWQARARCCCLCRCHGQAVPNIARQPHAVVGTDSCCWSLLGCPLIAVQCVQAMALDQMAVRALWMPMLCSVAQTQLLQTLNKQQPLQLHGLTRKAMGVAPQSVPLAAMVPSQLRVQRWTMTRGHNRGSLHQAPAGQTRKPAGAPSRGTTHTCGCAIGCAACHPVIALHLSLQPSCGAEMHEPPGFELSRANSANTGQLTVSCTRRPHCLATCRSPCLHCVA